jgi:hypothetical protein
LEIKHVIHAKIKKDLTEVNEPTGHMICMARQKNKEKLGGESSKFSEPYKK